MTQRGRKSREALSIVTPDPPWPQPVKEVRIPPCPDYLAKPEQRIWADVFHDFDLTTKAAQHVLTTALEAHQRARECREAIERDGMTVQGRDNQLKPHPLLAVERDARQSWLMGVRALGIEL